MKTFIFVMLLIISFPVLFSACQEEERLDIIEESPEMEVLSRGDADRWYLSETQLRRMFKFDATLDKRSRDELVTNFCNFLERHAPYRKAVYAVYQAIGNDEYKKVNITVNPSHSSFRVDNPPYALYDYTTNSIIFSSANEAKSNQNSLIHELLHHWQYLLIGKRAFTDATRNIEFEVIFLLDAMTVKNEGGSCDTKLIQYFKTRVSQTAYTEEQKREYLDAINTALNGNVSYIKDKLESFAKNYKIYDTAIYFPNWGFPIIDRLLNMYSSDYIW